MDGRGNFLSCSLALVGMQCRYLWMKMCMCAHPLQPFRGVGGETATPRSIIAHVPMSRKRPYAFQLQRLIVRWFLRTKLYSDSKGRHLNYDWKPTSFKLMICVLLFILGMTEIIRALYCIKRSGISRSESRLIPVSDAYYIQKEQRICIEAASAVLWFKWMWP